jgi:demethylmenaquinone methyltransferase/2-methoxy-6-polyprenyl-1,4-benzoquinol methylase
VSDAAVVDGMAAYYAKRAGEYERVYRRPTRQPDLRAREAWLAQQFVGRDVLEVACGTGWWTPHGAAGAASWLATDVNLEVLAVAQAKPMPASVCFQLLDAYSLVGLGARTFDAAFAGCWWSHVPLARLPAWLDALHARLSPGARVVMLDNRWVDGESTPLSRRDEEGNTYQQRVLDDGSVHEVLKNYPRPAEAIRLLGPRARDAHWVDGSHHWTLSYRLN